MERFPKSCVFGSASRNRVILLVVLIAHARSGCTSVFCSMHRYKNVTRYIRTCMYMHTVMRYERSADQDTVLRLKLWIPGGRDHTFTCIGVNGRTYVRTYVHTYIHTYIQNIHMHAYRPPSRLPACLPAGLYACIHTYTHTDIHVNIL